MKPVCGLNYEGGKIIKHILGYPQCLAFANVQIRMDSPWSGEVANDSMRCLGPSETQFRGYSERKPQMITQLTNVFRKAENIIAEQGNVDQLVVQIARGKACQWFIPDIINPIIATLRPETQSIIQLVKGYRTCDYYNHPVDGGRFIFINVGMFASVTSCDLVEVCVPVMTFDLDVDLKVTQWNHHLDDFGLTQGLTQMILGGLEDDAPFVEPSKYNYSIISKLFTF